MMARETECYCLDYYKEFTVYVSNPWEAIALARGDTNREAWEEAKRRLELLLMDAENEIKKEEG